jgi:hypothetical protein
MLEKFPPPSPKCDGTGFLVPVDSSHLPPTRLAKLGDKRSVWLDKVLGRVLIWLRNSFARPWEIQTLNEENYADLL